MSRRSWAWVRAGFTVLFLTILPAPVLGFLDEGVPVWPPIRDVVERLVGPLEGLVLILAVIGAVRAGAIIAKGYTKKSSPIHPLATSLQAMTGLYLTLWFLGLGEPLAMGLSERSLPAGPFSLTVLVDLRFFALLAIITALLIISKSILDRREARRAEEYAALGWGS